MFLPAIDGVGEHVARSFAQQKLLGHATDFQCHRHPAQALEEFTSRDDLMPTIEAILRRVDDAGAGDEPPGR